MTVYLWYLLYVLAVCAGLVGLMVLDELAHRRALRAARRRHLGSPHPTLPAPGRGTER